MNVEIGNPTYKMYEGEPDDDVGELLDADFALDPDKVGLGGWSYTWGGLGCRAAGRAVGMNGAGGTAEAVGSVLVVGRTRGSTLQV